MTKNDLPTKRLETLDAAKQWARKLSTDFGCIYSVLNDGYHYRVQAGGTNAVSHVASYFCGATITKPEAC